MVKCKECGCTCDSCLAKDHDVHLHVEIENLKQKLVERETHIVTMETNFLNEANKFPSGELVALREELLTWQDKYKRLYDAHRRVQRVNQGLEDKLLKLVDVCETDKNTLTKDVATLSHQLAEANYTIKKLTEDNERYKNDVSLAIQFLQCKQSNFVARRFDTLPQEVQVQVSSYLTNKRVKPEEKKSYEMKSIKVPIPTFPPTAMVYSVPKSPKPERKEEVIETSPEVDIVSAAIMAKVLEERQKEKAFAKHCDTCTCSKKLKIIYDISHHTTGTQTEKLSQTKEDNGNVVKVQPNNFLLDKSSNSAKNESSGPKKCSMRLQSGTRNILLDNAQTNISPVLYKRQHKGKREETPTTHERIAILNEHAQQRVAEWVRSNNLEEVGSSAENSQSDSLTRKNLGVDKVKYAEMEEHVKRFLFGESEFLKTVEIGKMKYQNYSEGCDKNECASVKSSQNETEI